MAARLGVPEVHLAGMVSTSGSEPADQYGMARQSGDLWQDRLSGWRSSPFCDVERRTEVDFAAGAAVDPQHLAATRDVDLHPQACPRPWTTDLWGFASRQLACPAVFPLHHQRLRRKACCWATCSSVPSARSGTTTCTGNLHRFSSPIRRTRHAPVVACSGVCEEGRHGTGRK